jgi:hypothetical protein
MHSPAQLLNGAEHWVVQLPASQRGIAFAGAEQTTLQPPQWLGSSSRRTHAEPQAANSGAHAKLHSPAMQNGIAPLGAVQVAPQPPQFCRSLLIDTQVESHSACPASHSSSSPERPADAPFGSSLLAPPGPSPDDETHSPASHAKPPGQASSASQGLSGMSLATSVQSLSQLAALVARIRVMASEEARTVRDA